MNELYSSFVQCLMLNILFRHVEAKEYVKEKASGAKESAGETASDLADTGKSRIAIA